MTKEPKPLNKVELWISEHAAPIFVVIAILIILGAGAVFWTYQKSGDAQSQVGVLRPQVTTINRAICDARSLESERRARRCAERIRVGLVNCRRVERCRAAFLAALTYPSPARPEGEAAAGGGDAQNPSQAGQQPGRGDDPGDQGKGNPANHGGSGGQHSTPAPEPATESPLPAKPSASQGNPAPSHSPETPQAQGPVETVGQTVNETVEEAGGVLGETTETVCRLVPSC